MSENGEIYTAGKNFTLPPAVTAVTNSNSERSLIVLSCRDLQVLLSEFSGRGRYLGRIYQFMSSLKRLITMVHILTLRGPFPVHIQTDSWCLKT